MRIASTVGIVTLLAAHVHTLPSISLPSIAHTSIAPIARSATHHIRGVTVWRAREVHELHNDVVVDAGGTLVIEAGVRVEARPGASITIARDGRINALGTQLQPIVLTCTSVPKYEGCWGGLTINGNAAINFGSTTSPAVRGSGASGCRESVAGDAGYGGCDPADSSGALRYVRVEYAARGLELLGVGARTFIDFLQVNRSSGDGITVSGGTVDLRHLFLTANQSRGLSWRAGWRGRGQFISVQQDGRANLGGIAGSNEGAASSSFDGEPRSAPTLMNVTIVSPLANADPNAANTPAALLLRRGTSAVLRDVLIHSAPIALDIDDARTCVVTAGSPPLTLTDVVVANTSALGSPDVDPLACDPYPSPDVESSWLADVINRVTVVTDPGVSNTLLRNATSLQLPDFRPNLASAAFASATAPPTDAFFDVSATYFGAVPVNLATANEIPWYAGWTTAAPIPPAPGVVAGAVTSASLGPLAGAIVRSTSGTETVTAALGDYQFSLPAGDHVLSAASLPIGCGASAQSVSVASGATATVNFAVECSNVMGLSLGTFHGCALAASGIAQCWGDNEYGMVGDGTNIGPRVVPVLVIGGNVFDAGSMSSGYTHTCALRNSRAVCWGLNFFGALGSGTAGFLAMQPVAVGTSQTPNFTRLSAGGYHSCALTASGAAWCWGWNQESQTGRSGSTAELLPVPVNTGARTFAQISSGESHNCALTDTGEAWCWGGNGRGELGSDPLTIGTQSATPVLVPGGHHFTSIDAGTTHTCAIDDSGTAYCWGSQEYGQLGNGLTVGESTGPVPVSGGAQYLHISAGGHTTCAVTVDHAVHCWGAGSSGSLGNGTTTTAQSIPVTVSGGRSAHGVVVNVSEPDGASACLFTARGEAFCWGAGSHGQLGTGTVLSSSVPVQVLIRSPNL